MKVTPATKNGYLLKKSSMEMRMDSMLIFPLDSSTSAANEGRGVERKGKMKVLREIWELEGSVRRPEIGLTKGKDFLGFGSLGGGEMFRIPRN